jgi:hypothetical protein
MDGGFGFFAMVGVLSSIYFFINDTTIILSINPTIGMIRKEIVT